MNTTEEVRETYIDAHRDSYERNGGSYRGQEGKFEIIADDFDAWLRAIKAEAWDEGFDNGYDQVLVEKSVEPGAGDLRVNPYIKFKPTYAIPFFGDVTAALAGLTIRKEQQ